MPETYHVGYKGTVYDVLLHPDVTGGYWVEVPMLPGCNTQGETVEECLDMALDAITGWLEASAVHS